MDFVYKTTSQDEFLLKRLDLDGADKMCLSMDDTVDEVSEFVKIAKSTSISNNILSPEYDLMRSTLGLSYDEMLMTLPKSILESRLNSAVEQLELILNELENREYLLTYLTIKRFLRSLSRPLVDARALKTIAAQEVHDGVKTSIMSLMPDKNGVVPKSFYNMAGSSTGRLTVKAGPNVLTMKSVARKALRSRYRNGKVLQIDLSAAEPNIALNVAGSPTNKDVYQHIATNVLGDRVTRADAKLIILCALYGQSSAKLQKSLPADVSAMSIIRKCRDYFGVDELERSLLRAHQNGKLRNVVGRPISLKSTDRRLLISYFLQSSAAELAILLFSDLMELFKKNEYAVTPLYVIHDALIVDCDEFMTNELLAKRIINLRMGKWSFYAKVSEVSEED